MSTDALTALRLVLEGKPQENGEYLHLVYCSGDRRQPPGLARHSCCCRPSGSLAVVLPADHPLRTGEPSAPMIHAARTAHANNIRHYQGVGDYDMYAVLRAALAVLRES